MKKFKCKRCGSCCKGESTVSLSKKDILKIAQFLNLSEKDFLELYTVKKGKFRIEMKVKDEFCIFFDKEKRGCKIHPVKPEKCKEWPLVSAIFEDEENFKIIQNSCLGLKELNWEQLKSFKNLHK
jgi:Fe-S-cluster containining protein|uniref:YkgJ family cysteine cluster protein n=1 Tax=Thermodesulfobacterium geofontis TaxID=1295609 RepID=A0A7V4JRB3_9BACT